MLQTELAKCLRRSLETFVQRSIRATTARTNVQL
jgi:hypothetical protein